MARVFVRFTFEQLKIINRALDLFSRVQMGQVGEVDNLLKYYGRFPDENTMINNDELNRQKKKHFFPGIPGDGYLAISSPEVHVDAKHAYEMQKLFAWAMAWHENPNGGITVEYDPPGTSKITDIPFPELSIDENDEPLPKGL